MTLTGRDKNVLRYFLKTLNKVDALFLTPFVYDILSERDETQAESTRKLEEITKDSSEKNSFALFLLGFCYDRGIGVAQNYEKARGYYLEAASLENAFAEWALGFMFARAKGVPEDAKKACEWLEKAAKKGYAMAQASLGTMYYYGSGIDKNEKKALELFKAAIDDDIYARTHIGLIYLNGQGVAKDLKLALDCFQKSANEEDSLAQLIMARLYRQGKVVKKDEKMAAEWFQRAAMQGEPEAECAVGVMYQRGNVLEKNEKKACEWFLKAANQGFALAQYNLGVSYTQQFTEEKDKKEGIEWFLKAAKQGNPEAQYAIGVMHQQGNVLEKNEEKACEWFLKAANQGHISAQCELGAIYTQRFTEEKYKKEGLEWLKKAANKGSTAAQYKLAVLYTNEDVNESFKWCKMAAESGHVRAQFMLGLMYITSGAGVEPDDHEGFKWIEKAALQGDKNALFQLGSNYKEGLVVTKDLKKAFDLYQSAALKGSGVAQCYLWLAYTEGLLELKKDPKMASEYFEKAVQQKDAAAKFILDFKYSELPENEKHYPEPPRLWHMAYYKNFSAFRSFLEVTCEQLEFSPTEQLDKGCTVLSLLMLHRQWLLARRTLKKLAYYHPTNRKLDAPLPDAENGWSLLKFSALSGQYEIVSELLKLGASIDEVPHICSMLVEREVEYAKTLNLLQAAEAVFALVEGCSLDAKSVEEKKKSEEVFSSEKLILLLKNLGPAVNGRKKGFTALQVAIENGNRPAIEVLLSHGVELPMEDIPELEIIAAFRMLDEVKKNINSFASLRIEQEREENAKTKDEGKLQSCKKNIEDKEKKIKKSVNRILKLSENLNDKVTSLIFYRLGKFLHKHQSHFTDMIFICLSKVTSDDENFEKANATLYYLSKKESRAYISVDTGGLEKERINIDSLDFATKAGKQIPPLELARELFSHLFDEGELERQLKLLGENASVDDVWIAAFGELQIEKKKTAEEDSGNAEGQPLVTQYKMETADQEKTALSQLPAQTTSTDNDGDSFMQPATASFSAGSSSSMSSASESAPAAGAGSGTGAGIGGHKRKAEGPADEKSEQLAAKRFRATKD